MYRRLCIMSAIKMFIIIIINIILKLLLLLLLLLIIIISLLLFFAVLELSAYFPIRGILGNLILGSPFGIKLN